MGASLAVEGATTTAQVFETYDVQKMLVADALRAGQMVVMGNLGAAHKPRRILGTLSRGKKAASSSVSLPSYSADYYNPIEEAFSKIEGFLGKVRARSSREALVEALGAALSLRLVPKRPEVTSSMLGTVR